MCRTAAALSCGDATSAAHCALPHSGMTDEKSSLPARKKAARQWSLWLPIHYCRKAAEPPIGLNWGQLERTNASIFRALRMMFWRCRPRKSPETTSCGSNVVDTSGGRSIPVMICGPMAVLPPHEVEAKEPPFIIRLHRGWRAEVNLNKDGVRHVTFVGSLKHPGGGKSALVLLDKHGDLVHSSSAQYSEFDFCSSCFHVLEFLG